MHGKHPGSQVCVLQPITTRHLQHWTVFSVLVAARADPWLGSNAIAPLHHTGTLTLRLTRLPAPPPRLPRAYPSYQALVEDPGLDAV